MKSVLVIFNGLKFPFYLMEYGLSQSKQHFASLHALFLEAKGETEEGYGFPSDLAQAETLTDSKDALEDDERIIMHHMKLAADMAATEKVPCTTELMKEASLSEILKVIKNFDLVCLDAAFDDETSSMLTNSGFTAKELMAQASSPVRLVSEDKRADKY